MNEFDQYVKHKIKAKYYIRYSDDFVFLSHNKSGLRSLVRYIVLFLRNELRLELHPQKVSISTFASGVDFLGWIHFSDHRVLRTSTTRRMFRNCVGKDALDARTQSYLGFLKYGNTHNLAKKLLSNTQSKSGVI
jgi:RNA-directed DNA polymerase